MVLNVLLVCVVVVGAGVLVLAVVGLVLDCYVCDSVVTIVVFRFVVGLVVIA